jgi:hypothetical protein
VYSPKFKVAYSSGSIIPQFEVVEASIFMTASDAQITGSVMSLPYTSVEMISQPLSSKITNINPFAVFSWNGSMVMSPSVDIWTEIENLSVITINLTETTTEYVTIRRPYPGPWPQPIWDGTPDLRPNWQVRHQWTPMNPGIVYPSF